MLTSEELATQVMDQIWLSVDVACQRSNATPELLLADDLGLKSMDAVAIVIDMERKFGIEVETAELTRIRSIGDVIELVAGKLHQPSGRRRP
jgi:acyl carrier protein